MRRVQHYDEENDCWVDADGRTRTSYDLNREREAQAAAQRRRIDLMAEQDKINKRRASAWLSFDVACRCVAIACIGWMLSRMFS